MFDMGKIMTLLPKLSKMSLEEILEEYLKPKMIERKAISVVIRIDKKNSDKIDVAWLSQDLKYATEELKESCKAALDAMQKENDELRGTIEQYKAELKRAAEFANQKHK